MGPIPGTYTASLQGDYRVFIPEPLPPQLDIPSDVLQVVEEAAHLLGQASMCRTLLPNPELLVYGSLQREAIASSTIEGTIATPDELVLFQADQKPEREEVREVANYAEALRWGCEQLKSLPITTRLILGLHERLLRGVRGATTAGRFKDRQNWIGPRPSTPIEEATFVPPPPEAVPELMAALERYINLPNQEPKVVQCALVHYQFETIHPFTDGNGRVGRLLIILHLIQLGLLSEALIHPSVYFERAHADYNERLRGVHDKGAWNEWIAYFAQAMTHQGQETIQLVEKMRQLQDQLHAETAEIRRRAAVQAVLDVFFHQPVLSITRVAELANLSYVTANTALNILEGKGIVREITGKRKGRFYACDPILRVIFGTDEER
jgi:Fic family protein